MSNAHVALRSFAVHRDIVHVDQKHTDLSLVVEQPSVRITPDLFELLNLKTSKNIYYILSCPMSILIPFQKP